MAIITTIGAVDVSSDDDDEPFLLLFLLLLWSTSFVVVYHCHFYYFLFYFSSSSSFFIWRAWHAAIGLIRGHQSCRVVWQEFFYRHSSKKLTVTCLTSVKMTLKWASFFGPQIQDYNLCFWRNSNGIHMGLNKVLIESR